MRRHDPDAEVTVVGAVIYSPEASMRLHRIVNPSDFVDLALGELFRVSPTLPTFVPDHGRTPRHPMSWEIRAVAAAHFASVDLADTFTVVNRRLALTDQTGHFARRVVAAADTRRRLAALADELAEHGYRYVPPGQDAAA